MVHPKFVISKFFTRPVLCKQLGFVLKDDVAKHKNL